MKRFPFLRTLFLALLAQSTVADTVSMVPWAFAKIGNGNAYLLTNATHKIQISWLNTYTGFTLESAAALSGSWSAVTNPVVSQSPDFVVTIDINFQPAGFFRLRK